MPVKDPDNLLKARDADHLVLHRPFWAFFNPFREQAKFLDEAKLGKHFFFFLFFFLHSWYDVLKLHAFSQHAWQLSILFYNKAHNKLFVWSRIKSFCVELTCSPCAWVGFLQIFQLPLTVQGFYNRLIGDWIAPSRCECVWGTGNKSSDRLLG